jgi:SPP1 family predicted phage head-tail adaptor
MKAGALRNRVEFLRPLVEQDELGQRVPGYTSLFEAWASVEPLKGEELFNGSQFVNTVDTRIEIRYPAHSALKPTDIARVKGPHGGDYNLVMVVNPEHGGKALSMIAKRVDSDGLTVTVPPIEPEPPKKVATFAPGGSITTTKTWEPVGEFAIECQAKLTANPSSGFYALATWNPGGPNVSLAYNASAGALEVRVIDATNGIIAFGTPVVVALPAAITDLTWFRMQVSAGNCAFFMSPDRAPDSWTFLGAVPGNFVQVVAGARNIDVGGGGGYYGFPSWEGDIGRVVAWLDVAMTQQAFDCDPDKWVSGTTFDSGGDTYTMNGGVTIG